MGPYKPLRNWVDEFIPYYMEIMGVDRPDRTHGQSTDTWHLIWFSFPRWAKHLPKLLEHSDAPSIVGLVALGGVFWQPKFWRHVFRNILEQMEASEKKIRRILVLLHRQNEKHMHLKLNS